jgi:hypothetical protein
MIHITLISMIHITLISCRLKKFIKTLKVYRHSTVTGNWFMMMDCILQGKGEV